MVFIKDVISLIEQNKFNNEDIAAKFQIELASTFAEIAIKIANENYLDKIGLTGGVAYNYSFSKTIKEKIVQSNMKFLEHSNIPPGDAGISTGQLIGGIFKSSKN